MAWLLTSTLFVVSLVVLVKSSGGFVHFSAKIARRLGASEFMIGLTLVAIGTSLPEFMNTIVASLGGVNGFALGNIMGSNMANMGLSIGVSVLLASIFIKPKLYRRELTMLILSTVAFVVAAGDGRIGRDEGFLLALLFIGYMLYVTKILDDFVERIKPVELDYFVRYLSKVDYRKAVRGQVEFVSRSRYLIVDLTAVIACGVLLVAGSKLLVQSVLDLTSLLGVSSAGVAATLVAVGTTTPELSVSLASVRRGFHDMLFGNIIGSNIINMLFIIGVGAFIAPFAISPIVLYWALPLLCLSTLLIALALMRKGVVPKPVGAAMLGLYIVFLAVMWRA